MSSASSSSASASEPDRARPEAAFPLRFGDRYVLLKELGQGGMGQVYMAITGQPGVERVCALKAIRDVGTERENELGTRFLDEAKVVTKLTHENLVYVFDFGVVDGQGYLAMEFVEGRTLTEVWNRCAKRGVGFPFGVSMYAVSELCAGLAYAHRAPGLGLIHRDVSPSNIMLSFTGGVKLIDFGLAKWKSKVAQTATGVNWGKVSYMSPEQYLGRPIDRRSDLYSAAVILWELLTGRQMFPSGEPRAHEPAPVPPSKINGQPFDELDAVVCKALAPNPEDRFQTGEELCSALTALLPREAGKLQVAEFVASLFRDDHAAELAAREPLVARAAALRDAHANVQAKRGPGAAGAEPEPDPDPLVGTVLADRYFIKRRIGEGAMGRVYEGHHTGIGRRVAIKIPRRAERRKSELVQRFRLEATAASQIGHRNIADVTDCGTTPSGDFFFVMEYVDGIDVDRLVSREGAMPVERALAIGLQICRALEAAHGAGIIHRDLKPSNVMVLRTRDEADFIKVLDFGVAKFLRGDALPDGEPISELTHTHAAVGTPRYMAPEQIDSGARADFRSDIYALGGVLYFMLTGGRAPVEGDSVQNIWRRKLHQDATPLGELRRGLPAGVEELVMRCLERDPERRPQSMEEVRRTIVRLLAAVGTTDGADAALPALVGKPGRGGLRRAKPGAPPAHPTPATAVDRPFPIADEGRPSSTTEVTPESQPAVRSGRRRALAGAALTAVFLGSVGVGLMWKRLSLQSQARGQVQPRAQGQPPPTSAAPAPTAAVPPAPPAPPAQPSAEQAAAPAPGVAPPPRSALPAAGPAAAPRPAVQPARSAPPPAPQPARSAPPTTPAAAPAVAAPPPAQPARTAPSAIRPDKAARPLKDPEAARRFLEQADVAFQEARYPDAVDNARKALAAGASVDAWLTLGKTYRNMARYKDAIEAYDHVLRLDPQNAKALKGRQRAEQESASRP